MRFMAFLDSGAVKRPLTVPTPPWAGKTRWTADTKKRHYRARNYNREYRNSRSGKIEFSTWLSVNTGKSLNRMECLGSSLLRGRNMYLATTPLWRVQCVPLILSLEIRRAGPLIRVIRPTLSFLGDRAARTWSWPTLSSVGVKNTWC
jgi:hypothetical protein